MNSWKMKYVGEKKGLTKGKTYAVIDGRFQYDNGHYSCEYESFAELNKILAGKFTLVEDKPNYNDYLQLKSKMLKMIAKREGTYNEKKACYGCPCTKCMLVDDEYMYDYGYGNCVNYELECLNECYDNIKYKVEMSESEENRKEYVLSLINNSTEFTKEDWENGNSLKSIIFFDAKFDKLFHIHQEVTSTEIIYGAKYYTLENAKKIIKNVTTEEYKKYVLGWEG